MHFREWLMLQEVNHFFLPEETTLILPGPDDKPMRVRVAQIDMKYEKYHPLGYESMIRNDGPAWQVKLPFSTSQGDYLIYDNGTAPRTSSRVFGRIGPRQPQKEFVLNRTINPRPGMMDNPQLVEKLMSPLDGPSNWWQRAEMQDAQGKIVYYLVPGNIPYKLENLRHFVPSHRDEWLKERGLW